MSVHWACEKCLVRPCCTKACYKKDMTHHLCETCPKTTCRISTLGRGWEYSCEKIREYKIHKRWAKLMIPIMLENNILSQFRLNKVNYENKR